MLWSAPEELNKHWNVLAPGVVNDLNEDGVNDLVVINGGDTRYKPQVVYLFILVANKMSFIMYIPTIFRK